MALRSQLDYAERFELQRRKLRELLSTIWLPMIPLLISLSLLVTGVGGQEEANLLVATLGICSLLLLVKFVRRGVTLGRWARIGLIAGFFFWYAYPGMVTLLSPVPDFGADLSLSIDAETIVAGVAYLSLFLSSVVLALSLFSSPQAQESIDRPGEPVTDPIRLLRLASIACVIGVAPILLSGGGITQILGLILQSRAVEKPWQQTGNLGNSTSALSYLTSTAMIAGTCLLWAAVRDRRLPGRRRLAVGLLAAALSALLIVDQGTRAVSALVLIPPVLLGVLSLWQRHRRVAILLLLLSAGATVLLLQLQLIFRYGYTQTLLEGWTTLGGTIDYFKENLMALLIVPTYHDYFRESVLVQFLVSPIPRFLWASKPASEVVWFYSLWRWNVDIYEVGGNVFPGLVGQFYMSWGVFGPAMAGLLMGWIALRVDRFLARASTNRDLYQSTLGVMFAVWIFLSYRVLSPGFFYPLLIAALIIRVSRQQDRTPPREMAGDLHQ
jgi:oligosaccharide repeat unit polymerase